MTDAEQLLWRELRRQQLGWRFRRQFPIPPYVVDFACVEAHLIVEADGGQHAVPDEHARRDTRLQQQGWRLLRFWNNDIIENREGVLQTIAAALSPSISPHPNPPPLAGKGVEEAGALPSPSIRTIKHGEQAPASSSPSPQAGEG